MKMCILGASSFIGSYVKNYFEKLGYLVVGTYQTPHPFYEEDSSMFPFQMHEGACMKLLQTLEPDIIFYSLRGDFSLQLSTLQEVIDYIKNDSHKKLVFLSTGNVFDGDLSHIHIETDKCYSHSDYGKFKIQCEKLISTQIESQSVILRIPQVYDKNCPRITRLQNLIHEQKPIETVKNLEVNLTTREQISSWTLYILSHNLNGIFHVGTDDTCEYMTFDQTIIKALSLGNATYSISYEFPQTHYQALLPNRSEIPDHLHMKISDLLDYLSSHRVGG